MNQGMSNFLGQGQQGQMDKGQLVTRPYLHAIIDRLIKNCFLDNHNDRHGDSVHH